MVLPIAVPTILNSDAPTMTIVPRISPNAIPKLLPFAVAVCNCWLVAWNGLNKLDRADFNSPKPATIMSHKGLSGISVLFRLVNAILILSSNGENPIFNPSQKPTKNALIGPQYFQITNANAATAVIIQVIGLVNKAIDRVLIPVIKSGNA